MHPAKKLFAAFTAFGFRNDVETIEIKKEQEAVQHALKKGYMYFFTYEVTTVTINGKELKGKPENGSFRRWTNIDKLYTRDEVIAEMEKDGMFPAVTQKVIDSMRNEVPANTIYMSGLERPGEYTRVSPGEKVFDSKGRQTWPQLPAPGRTPGMKR